jgi:hypothetical protein
MFIPSSRLFEFLAQTHSCSFVGFGGWVIREWFVVIRWVFTISNILPPVLSTLHCSSDCLVSRLDTRLVLYPRYLKKIVTNPVFEKTLQVLYQLQLEVKIIMASTFSEYVTPASFSAFSASEFYSMTFQRATELTYPKIAPPNSVDSWCYSTNIPTSAAGTIIIPGDIIPNSIDLLPIFRDMERAFGEGMRSVVLTMMLAESGFKNTYEYHFTKVSQRHIIFVH